MINNKNTWTQLSNHCGILNFLCEKFASHSRIYKHSLSTYESKMVLWPDWSIEKTPWLHLKKDPTAVQSQSDFFANMICKKRYFIIFFICIFLLVSLRIFLCAYCLFEFLLWSFVCFNQSLAYFYGWSSACYKM